MADLNDPIYFRSLDGLLSTSSQHAVLGNQSGLDEAKTMATQLLKVNGIFERNDSPAFSLRLTYAQILYNQGSLDDAARIRQDVLAWRRRNKEPQYPWKLVEALRSYAESLMVPRDTTKLNQAMALLKEALIICETSLDPENMHTLDCKEALAELHKIEGRTAEAIKVGYEVLKIREKSSGDTYLKTMRTMSNLAVYLALASRWEESEQMISRAKRLANEHLNNATSLSGAKRLPATERGGEVVEGTQSTLVDRSRDSNHKSCRHSLWRRIMSAPARYLHSLVRMTRSNRRVAV
jgi:tetratricopeptide (TPR) repeat protein